MSWLPGTKIYKNQADALAAFQGLDCPPSSQTVEPYWTYDPATGLYIVGCYEPDGNSPYSVADPDVNGIGIFGDLGGAGDTDWGGKDIDMKDIPVDEGNISLQEIPADGGGEGDGGIPSDPGYSFAGDENNDPGESYNTAEPDNNHGPNPGGYGDNGIFQDNGPTIDTNNDLREIPADGEIDDDKPGYYWDAELNTYVLIGPETIITPGANSNFSDDFSNYLDISGLMLSALEGSFKYMGDQFYRYGSSMMTAEELTAALKVLAKELEQYAKIGGRTIGWLAIIFEIFEKIEKDGLNGVTPGDWTKLGIQVIATETAYGWVYIVTDTGVGIGTGTSLTDAIGNIIDYFFYFRWQIPMIGH